jgi:D-ribulokinase
MADLETALALISGTSDCHMAVSRAPKYIPGIWGPYFGAMVPDMWLTEAGQTTAGSALDAVIESHPNYPALASAAKKRTKSVYELLNEEVARLQKLSNCGPEITRDLHVLPYFLGNRSPHADPRARASIDGIMLDDSLSSQALLYYATLQSLAYGTCEIIEKLNAGDYSINTIYITGGGAKNSLLLQETADITSCNVVLPAETESVLLGSAILAAAASGLHEDVETAMQKMSRTANTIAPRAATAPYHKAKYKIFKDLYTQQKRRRTAMKSFGLA